jgi:subtilisin family serine protease
MGKWRAILCLLNLAAILLLFRQANGATNQLAAASGTPTKHTYIVTLRREADQDGCVKEHQVKRGRIFRHALNGFTADLDDAAVQRLKKDKRVLAVESNGQVVPNLILPPQIVPSGVLRMGLTNFPEANFIRPDERIDVDVALLDTGIDINHPDLNIFKVVGFADPGLSGADWNGHGTHVAGIIGALNNNAGVIGVAPGVRLWSVQVLGQQQSGWDNVIAGFEYIAQHADKISVVNCSLGPQPSSTTNPVVAVEQVVSNLVSLGVVVVACAGNNNGDIAGPDGIFGTGDDFIPASLPEAMAVSAMDPTNDTIANFSNFSSVSKVPSYVNSPGLGIDVAAPGASILSTYLSSGNGYAALSGTSMACPHVVGIVALYIAANGRATNAAGVYKIRQAIIDSALSQSQWNTNNTHDPDGNPEPLAMPSTNWIPKPNIISQGKTNGSVQLYFNAVPGYNYAAQYQDLLNRGQWTNLTSSVTGMGSVVLAALSDLNPNPSARFYRLGMLPAPAAILTTNTGSGKSAQNGWGYGILTNQSGLVGNSFRFLNTNLLVAGTGCYADVPHFDDPSGFYPILNPNGAFTVEFWARPAQLVNDLFCPAASLDNSQNGGNSRCGWVFYQTAGNQWRFSVGNTNGFVATVNGGTVQANTWQHVTGVYDGANISLYVNGQLVAGATSASGFSPNRTQQLRFGAASDGTRTFDGWLDEPAIYTSALSATTISAHFNAATTNNAGYATQILGDAPVGYWHFD